MSMNLHITASGEVVYPSGKKQTVIESFQCAPTPTRITAKILASEDKIQAYKDWIIEVWSDTLEDEYDFNQWDDKTDYFLKIGQKPYRPSTEHFEKLNAFLKDIREKGLELDLYAM